MPKSTLTQIVPSSTLLVDNLPPSITPMPGYYWVRYPDYVRPGTHLVRKDKTCACDLGADCPAVPAVAAYLRQGGERAPDVPTHQLIPAACPICGGAVKFAPRLCSPMRGAGWVCLSAAPTDVSHWPARYFTPGESHYWQFMWAQLAHSFLEKRP